MANKKSTKTIGVGKQSGKNVNKSTKKKKGETRGRPRRPTAMTDIVIRKIVDAIKYDRTEREACRRALVPRSTYCQWKQKNYIIKYQFAEIDENGQQVTIDTDIAFCDLIDYRKSHMSYAAGKILYYNIANKKSGKAAIDFLERRDSRYKIKGEVDHTGKVQVIFGGNKSQFIKDIKNDSDTDDGGSGE